jgi:hypothetical protein
VEYSRLKKAVEHQAKEAKSSFNGVDSAESRAYKKAFVQWMEAKHSFRGRKTPTKETSDSNESEGEEQTGGPSGTTSVSATTAARDIIPIAAVGVAVAI